MTSIVFTDLRKMLALRGTWHFLLLQPVAVPFFISNGLSLSDVFWLQSLFLAALCLSDIPAGILAGRIGEHRALIAACTLKGIGGVILCFPSKSSIFFAYVIIGIANALYAAVESTLLISSISVRSEKINAIAKVQSLSQGVMFASVLLSGLAGSTLAQQHGFRILIIANAIFAWSSFIMTAFIRIPVVPKNTEGSANDFSKALELISMKPFGHQMILIGSGVMVAAVVPIVIQNRLMAEGAELVSFGFIFVFQQILAVSLGFAAARWEETSKKVAKLKPAFICTLWIGGFICIYLGSIYLMVVALVLIELARIGLLINTTSRFHSAVPDELRTKTVAILNFTTRLYSAAVLVLLGSLSRFTSIPGVDMVALTILVTVALIITSTYSMREVHT
jgi:MFS family permease